MGGSATGGHSSPGPPLLGEVPVDVRIDLVTHPVHQRCRGRVVEAGVVVLGQTGPAPQQGRSRSEGQAELGVDHRHRPPLGCRGLGHDVDRDRRQPDHDGLDIVGTHAVEGADGQQGVDGALVVAAAGVALDARVNHLQRTLAPALHQTVGHRGLAVGGQEAALATDAVDVPHVAVAGQQRGLHPVAGRERRMQALRPGAVGEELHAA